MTEQEYRALDALNYSTLKHILRSPAHYKFIKDNPIEPTKAMQFGTLVHMRILEPSKYQAIVVSEILDRRTKAGKERAEQIETEGKMLISPDESQKIENIYQAIMRNPDAARFVTNGEREQTFTWTDIETGLKCKARPDFVHAGRFIVDIKTSKDASPNAFSRTAASLMYHFQAAFYLDGVSTATTQNYTDFVFLVVEPEPPYGVALYSLDLMAIEAGRVMYRKALSRIKDCEADGLFPAYPAGLQTLSLPNWVTYAAQEAFSADQV